MVHAQLLQGIFPIAMREVQSIQLALLRQMLAIVVLPLLPYSRFMGPRRQLQHFFVIPLELLDLRSGHMLEPL